MKYLLLLFFTCIALLFSNSCFTQITIVPDTTSTRLVQQLVGGGITISNMRFTGAKGAAGLFNVTSSTPSLGLDSGIVLSTGYVKSNFLGTNRGIDYLANGTIVSNNLNRPGDADLASIILANLDAAVLEFDFIPIGDSINFRYVFASEEYPGYNCSQYNDVFAFFISGPGIVGNKNIALVPGTNIPVAINSVNNGVPSGPGATLGICNNMGPGSPFTQYYTNNNGNAYIAFNGFTKVFTASSQVQPCQTYHLKLAIADGVDRAFDSGVFLEAKSLRSSGLNIQNNNPVSNTGEPYLIEGCNTGGIKVFRQNTGNYAQSVSLVYAGTAQNGVDVNLLPASAIIPANDSFVFIPIVPIVDHIPEGIEKLKIYVSNGCANNSASFSDSIEIQIRDFDTLLITPKDSAGVCRNGALQLSATPGHTTYSWSPAAQLSNPAIRNPLAMPASDSTFFVCTATQGNCEAKDSVKLTYKRLKFISKQEVLCKNGTTGQIKVATGWQWIPPLQFWVNNQPHQADSTFNNLAAGNYMVKVQDASGCVDSLSVTLSQLFPDLVLASPVLTQASCADTSSGSAVLSATGGLQPYHYIVDGTTYPVFVTLTLPSAVGLHTVAIKDSNNCRDTTTFSITFNNTVQVNAGSDTTICEGSSVQLLANTNAPGVLWSPAATLNNPAIINPVASPAVTATYIVTAKDRFCIKKDTLTVEVRPSPIANAGPDTAICTGGTVKLTGSGGVSYRWSPATYLNNTAIASPTSRPANTIFYKLWVTNQFGCTSLQPDSVKVRTVPSVLAFAGRDTTAAVGQPLQLLGLQIGDTSAHNFTWTPATGLNNDTIYNPVATLYADQTYRLTLHTPQGCEGHDDITIKVYKGPEIYVPSGFTPNGDGRNDMLRAIAVGIKQFNYFNVYNRWGQLIFHTSIPEKGWDGKINGQLQANQSFIWMAEGIGYNNITIQRKGSVIIIP